MAINPSAIFSALATASDLLSNFFAVDIVAIYDAETFEQVFADGRPIRAEVRETSTVMNHPVETGTMLSDHHIINQTEINMVMFVKSDFYNSVYVQLRNAWVAATKLSVQTRTGVYHNMIIVDMPHIEEPDTFDAVTLLIRFKEVIYVVPNSVSELPAPPNFTPIDPVNSNTVLAGLKYPAAVTNPNVAAVQALLTGGSFKLLGGL